MLETSVPEPSSRWPRTSRRFRELRLGADDDGHDDVPINHRDEVDDSFSFVGSKKRNALGIFTEKGGKDDIFMRLDDPLGLSKPMEEEEVIEIVPMRGIKDPKQERKTKVIIKDGRPVLKSILYVFQPA